MKRNVKILGISGLIIIIVFLSCLYSPWVIVPINSSARMLTISTRSYSAKQVLLKHYINNEHISDYLLELNIEPLSNKPPQTYKLPELTEGEVEVNIKFDDGIEDSSDITIRYNNARDFCKKGLLIYTISGDELIVDINGFTYHKEYTYFISGNDTVCYYLDACTGKWYVIEEFSNPKMLVKKIMGYSPLYYGWKENKWIKLQDNGN